MPHICLSSSTKPSTSTTADVGDLRGSAFTDAGNRREFTRTSANKAAMMRTDSGERVPCRVVDVSAGGARIEVSQGVSIPSRFKLLIPEDLFEAECEVRYLDNDCAGVMFTSNRLEALAAYG